MKQLIQCPNCNSVELGTVIEGVPFYTYLHTCQKCGYIIMESEWQQMKAVSVRNPWGWLIFNGKDIENRTWPTKFRGRVLIHAGARPIKMINPNNVFTYDQWESLTNDNQVKLIGGYMPCSAIIGSVEIVDCVQNHPSVWAEHETIVYSKKQGNEITVPVWNWVLDSPTQFEKPILNVKGKLSFFYPEIR